jgi:hypothetical protein
MAAIHHRRPLVNEIAATFTDILTRSTSLVKREPGFAKVSDEEVLAAFENYRTSMPKHRKELGKEICVEADKAAMLVLMHHAAVEAKRDPSSLYRLTQIQGVRGGDGGT